MRYKFSEIALICFFVITIVGCRPHYGDVRDDFLTVVKQTGDTQKYRAALYLARSMENAYSLQGKSLDLYCRQLDSFYLRKDANVFTLREFNDSLFKTSAYFADLARVYDKDVISLEYLVNHLNLSIELWHSSKWAKNLSFKDFCSYLLPYRVADELIEDWHTEYRRKYDSYLDSLSRDENTTLEQFYSVVNDIICEPHSYSSYPSGKPALPPSILLKIKAGSCDDYVSLFTHIARTYGIPVAEDYTPQWGNHSQGHTWVAIIDGEETRHYAVGEPLFHEREKPFTWKLVKAYRKQNGNDVTDKYVKTIDFSIKTISPARGDAVALAVFNNKDWIPICYTKRHGNMATFRKVGYPSVFLPMFMRNGVITEPAGLPILIDSTGLAHELIPNTDSLVSVVLKRKYLETHIWRWVDSLKNGHFELSNQPTFDYKIDIYIPDSIGFNYQQLYVDSRVGDKYRYFRYIPQKYTSGNISEIELYDSAGKQLLGSVIGNYISSDSSHSMDKAFDGNPLTFARCKPYQEEAWLGLDIGKGAEISKICFLPRSDDNFIREGEEYELYYWNGRWLSLGKQMGSRITQELIYNNVPYNALLLLHNHSKGKEERIFTYANGNQIWW